MVFFMLIEVIYFCYKKIQAMQQNLPEGIKDSS